MTGWIIAGSIIAVILILLMTSVKVRFEFYDGLRLKISWLFLTFVRVPAKPKKKRRKKVKKSKSDSSGKTAENAAEQEKSPESEEKAPEPEKDAKSPDSRADKKKKSKRKLGLEDIFELVKLVWQSLSKPLQRLLKATRFIGFRLNIVCGGSDAAKAALNYGRINIAAGAALAFLDGCFTLKKPDLNISCDFLSEETRMECEFTARLTPIAALAFVFWVIGRAVRRYLGSRKAKSAVAKLRK